MLNCTYDSLCVSSDSKLLWALHGPLLKLRKTVSASSSVYHFVLCDFTHDLFLFYVHVLTVTLWLSVVIFVSSSSLLTAGISEGSKVYVSPLNATKPPLRNALKAHTIHLKEINPVENSDTKPSDTAKGKRRDWLSLMVRETLGPFTLFRNIFEHISDTHVFSGRQIYYIFAKDRSRVRG